MPNAFSTALVASDILDAAPLTASGSLGAMRAFGWKAVRNALAPPTMNVLPVSSRKSCVSAAWPGSLGPGTFKTLIDMPRGVETTRSSDTSPGI